MELLLRLLCSAALSRVVSTDLVTVLVYFPSRSVSTVLVSWYDFHQNLARLDWYLGMIFTNTRPSLAKWFGMIWVNIRPNIAKRFGMIFINIRPNIAKRFGMIFINIRPNIAKRFGMIFINIRPNIAKRFGMIFIKTMPDWPCVKISLNGLVSLYNFQISTKNRPFWSSVITWKREKGGGGGGLRIHLSAFGMTQDTNSTRFRGIATASCSVKRACNEAVTWRL